jgi:hypothetical protein
MIRNIKDIISVNSDRYIFFTVILVVYLVSGFGVTVSNDATTNMEQIVALNILSRSSHFTFHLFGVLFYIFFSKIAGLSPISSVEIMLSLFSLAGSVALFFIVRNKFEDIRIAFITIVIYALSSGIFRFSIQAEYLVLVPSLALISLAFYVYQRYILSGIAFALGLLTSPFILFFIPAFLIYNTWKTLFTKRNFLFLGGFLSFYLIVSLFTIKETLGGDWSYGVVLNYYKEAIAKINYLRVTSIWIYGYLRSFLVVIPFIIIGLYICYKTQRRLFFLILIMGLLHLPLAIPEARYGAYQFTMYPFIAILAALGINTLFARNKVAVFALMTLFIFVNFYIVLTERKFNRELRDTYVMIQKDPAIPEGSVLFLYQASKPVRTLYAPKLDLVDMLTDYQEGMAVDLPGYQKPDLNEIISTHEHLYLLESGTSMPDDNFKLLFSGFVKGQGAKVKGFGREKLLLYLRTAKFTKLSDYPIDVYRIEKQ